MCIRTEAGFCAITYSACPDPVNGGTRGSFLLNLNAQNNIDNARSRDNNCQNDYLLIPGGLVPFDFSNIDGQVNNIFCGTALGFSGGGASPVTSGSPVNFSFVFFFPVFSQSSVVFQNFAFPHLSNLT